MVVDGGDFQPVGEEAGHHRRNFRVEQDEIAHHHRAVADLSERGVRAEREARLDRHALDRDAEVCPRHADPEDIAGLELARLAERLLDGLPVRLSRGHGRRRAQHRQRRENHRHEVDRLESHHSLLALQHRIEPVEDRHAALEQIVVVSGRFGERPERQVHAGRLVARELAVVQIGLVDDLGDQLDAAVLQPETLHQRLERAVLAVVPVLGAQHVERDSFARGVRGVREREDGVRVAEALDEPRRGDAVDVRARTSHPRAAARRQRTQAAGADGRGPRLHGAKPLGRRLPERSRALTGRRFQIIDRVDPVELALEPVELGPQLCDGAAMARAVAVDLAEHLPASPHDRLVFGAPRLVEQRGELLVLHGLHAVDTQERHLAAERLDLLDEPLEELGRLGGLGQDPAGAAQPDGAHALELAPDADAVARGRRRQGHEEGQPPHWFNVTLATAHVNGYTRLTTRTGGSADAGARFHAPRPDQGARGLLPLGPHRRPDPGALSHEPQRAGLHQGRLRRGDRHHHRRNRAGRISVVAADLGLRQIEGMTLGFLWEMRRYFRQVAGQLVLGSLAGILMNTAVVLPAILLGRAIGRALAWERGSATAADGSWAALAFIGGTLLTELPRIAKRWWLMTANARIRANVRADAFRGVLGWPMADVQRTPVGELMARIVADVEVLGVGVREFTIETWDTVLFSLSFVVAMLVFDPGLTLLALLPAPFAMVLAHAAGRWVARRTTKAREANAELTAAIQESLTGVRVLRLFGRVSASVERIADLSGKLAQRNLSLTRLRGGLQPIYTTLMIAGVLLVVWKGSERVVAGAMTVGAFVAYLELFLRFVNRGHRIPQLVNSMQSGAAAYARLRPLLAPPLTVEGEPRLASFDPGHIAGIARRPTRATARPTGPVAVTVRGLTFRYPGAETPALRGIDLDIAAGSLVAITGPVGAGKSALARAILGLHPVESGIVLVGDRSPSSLTSDERAGLIGYLPQDTLLFSGSLRENLTLTGRDEPRDDGQLIRAVRLAALEEDVLGFPDGLDTEVGEQGVRVSGGQRQRIGLARAIAAGAPGLPGLLVLDDPFSAVDVATEARIVESLKQAFGPDAADRDRATVILCSHRLAAFPYADLVVVLQDGRIAAAGTHVALLAESALYARIFQAQLNAEVAAEPEVPR